jgi:hypothetical protein
MRFATRKINQISQITLEQQNKTKLKEKKCPQKKGLT